MKNKSVVWIVLVIVALIAIGAYVQNKQASAGQGRIVLGITDAAPNMGEVSSVLVTVDKVEMHSAADNWVTVSSETKEYDLLVLKQSGVVSLLANSSVTAGTYDQIRLMISKVVVTNGGVKTEAKLPSGELKIVGNIVVEADKTSSVVLDFIADKSLHMTGNGKIIFAPVIRIEKQTDVNIELKSNNEVDIKDGRRENDENVGMDAKGEFRNNFELKGDLSIDENDEIQGEDDEQDDNDDEGKDEDDGEDKTETNDDDDKLTLNFGAQNNSGLTGTATLSGEDGKVKVTLKTIGGLLGGLPGIAQPAHIHTGTCANIGGVKYPLTSVVSGKSETTLSVSLAQIKAGLPLAINVHKSVAEISVYVGCTDIKF